MRCAMATLKKFSQVVEESFLFLSHWGTWIEIFVVALIAVFLVFDVYMRASP